MNWVKAELKADFPFEPHPDYEDAVGGRNVAEALSAIMQQSGCRTEPLEFAGDHGWEWEVWTGKHRMWAQLTHFGPEAILLLGDMDPDGWFRRRASAPFLDALRLFGTALAADQRFHDVEWRWQDSRGRDAGLVSELMPARSPP